MSLWPICVRRREIRSSEEGQGTKGSRDRVGLATGIFNEAGHQITELVAKAGGIAPRQRVYTCMC